MDLFLLRHAKSSWSKPGTRDYDRPLNDRGTISARQIARHIAENEIRPDVVICSGANRTRLTLEPILEAWKTMQGEDPQIIYSDDIYEAGADAYLASIANLRDGMSAMVIGHNPTTENLAVQLTAEGRNDLLVFIGNGYPTGGMTHLSFSDGSWTDAVETGGRFVSFISPRTLPIWEETET